MIPSPDAQGIGLPVPSENGEPDRVPTATLHPYQAWPLRAGPTPHILDLAPHIDDHRLAKQVAGVIQGESGEVIHSHYDAALSLEEVTEQYVDEAAGDRIEYT